MNKTHCGFFQFLPALDLSSLCCLSLWPRRQILALASVRLQLVPRGAVNGKHSSQQIKGGEGSEKVGEMFPSPSLLWVAPPAQQLQLLLSFQALSDSRYIISSPFSFKPECGIDFLLVPLSVSNTLPVSYPSKLHPAFSSLLLEFSLFPTRSWLIKLWTWK